MFDLEVGSFFKSWQILSKYKDPQRRNNTYYEVACKCGSITNKRFSDLKNTKNCKFCATLEKQNYLDSKVAQIINKTFGKWLVIERGFKPYKKSVLFVKVRCCCGLIAIISYDNIVNGASKSCNGCAHAKIIDIGSVFGSWLVKNVYKKNGGYSYLCMCQCGIEQIISGSSLRGGHTSSCKKCAHKKNRASLYEKNDEIFSQYIDKKYNSWTILQGVRPLNKKGLYCLVRCDCNNEAVVLLHNILYGKSKKCRACNDNRGLIPKGAVYGSWTVVELDDIRDKHGQRKYICKCNCGKQSSIAARDLKRKKSTQCASCHVSQKNLKHGYAYRGQRNSTYSVWVGIRDRCLNINHKNYDVYGGRGIRLCERWQKFPKFLEDMGFRPEGLEIDRTDPDGDYEPNNCRWVTPAENKANRRISKKYKGQYVTIKKSLLCQECLNKFLKR